MGDGNYAGFWIRLGAVLIDLVVMLIALNLPLLFIYGSAYFEGDTLIHGFWDVMLSYVAPFIATVWFWLRYLGTPGKMILKLKVVDAKTGNKMSLGQAIGRYFAYIPAALPFCLGLLWIGFDKHKQGWHDKLAGTVVIMSPQTTPERSDEAA